MQFYRHLSDRQVNTPCEYSRWKLLHSTAVVLDGFLSWKVYYSDIVTSIQILHRRTLGIYSTVNNYITKVLTFKSRWHSSTEAILFMTGTLASKRLFETSASSKPSVRNVCIPGHCSPDVPVCSWPSSSSVSSLLSSSELSRATV